MIRHRNLIQCAGFVFGHVHNGITLVDKWVIGDTDDHTVFTCNNIRTLGPKRVAYFANNIAFFDLVTETNLNPKDSAFP